MGCPLNCIWCHNPEGISEKALLSYSNDKCSGCGACVRICPEVHGMENSKHLMNRKNCNHCFKCVEVCPVNALEQVGREMDTTEVFEAVTRDKRYYETSGGGITVSGGEPMRQFSFTYAVLEACKTAGINTAMETSGFAPKAQFKQILPQVDTFLYDIKELNPEKHKEYTGADNSLILNNLAFLAGKGNKIIVRCPVIPGLNDRIDHFTGLAELSQKYDSIEGIEIMPYHKLGVSKSVRMGLAKQNNYDQPDVETVTEWNKIIESAGGKIVKY